MNIEQEMLTKEALIAQLTSQINALEQQKQQVLQELLRSDGELRLLKRIQEERKNEEKKS